MRRLTTTATTADIAKAPASGWQTMKRMAPYLWPKNELWVRQRVVHLTRTEFELLNYMARNRGRVLTHAMLKTAIWGDDSEIGHDSLKQFIGALRKKIEVDPRNPQWLVSEHGVGYALLLD